MILDIFTFIVLGVVIVATAFLVVKLGTLPGKIAAERNHPQTEAIRVTGWIGILTLGVVWFVALIWAYTQPLRVATAPDEGSPVSSEFIALTASVNRLSDRLEAMEKQLDALKPK